MLDDIRHQPDSLARVIGHHFGAGRRQLLDIAERLKSARRIVVSGMGASHFAAMPLAYALNASLLDASELLYYGQRAREDAVVVLVSRSGNTVEVVKLIPLLREMGARIIGITNESDSALAREADEVLLVNAGRDEMVAVQTYTGATMAMLLLAAAVTGGLDDDLRRDAESTTHAVAGAIEHLVPASEEWRDFLDAARVIYVIGRGPSIASVCEGALLFNETAKLPSVAAPAGVFRHGPVEVVDENFRGIIFANQTATREIDLALAGDLRRMGARVETIAPDGSWPIPATPEYFAPVSEIIPVQMAAFRAALWRGIRPGDFRYVSQVTTTETGFKAYGR